MFSGYRLPFIRNNYYEGKLLRANDLTLEQQYNNDKRRIMNKYINGFGVIAGLEIDKTDQNRILLHPGLCMDHTGNEIVVPNTEELDLKNIEGYIQKDYERNVYLAIEYNEEYLYDKDIEGEVKNPGSIKEGYKLKVIDELEEETYKSGLTKVYHHKGSIIYNELPPLVESDRAVKGKLMIENPSDVNLSVLIKSDLDRLLTMDFKPKITLKGHLDSETIYKEFTYNLRVIGNDGEEATITYEDITLSINGVEHVLETKEHQKIQVTNKNRYEHKSIKTIYLARVSLAPYNGEERINKIENLPFNQWLQSPGSNERNEESKPLTTVTNTLNLLPEEEPRAEVKYDEEKNKMSFTFGLPKPKNLSINDIMSTGVATISLGNGGKEGRCYYSDFITHRLGHGPVGIILAIEEKMKPLSGLPEPEAQFIFGDFDVFSESDCISQVPPLKMGAVLYPKEGRFKIGIKLKESTKLKYVHIRWWAYRNTNEVVADTKKQTGEEVKISIKPEKIELQKGQKIQLKADVENTSNTNVTWRILDNEGGKITQKGFYTAPSTRGVFKIEATSIADFSKTAKVIVVVKE